MRIVYAFVLALVAVVPAHAQINANAFSGFGSGSGDPVAIEADQLEVVDGENRAVFSGNVVVKQGTSTIRTARLEVFYEQGANGGQGDIRLMNLSGGLIATTEDSKAVAERGTYDVQKEFVTLDGDVVLTQERNVAKGCSLRANLKTNQATLGSCGSGRVTTILTPGSNN